MSLFEADQKWQENVPEGAPLAVRMRPRTVGEFVGQEHFFGEGRLLRRMLLADRLSSLIFYGPPGTGKTALACVIANTTKSAFVRLNAAEVGTHEVREVLRSAKERLRLQNRRTVLFIDELHRFNKAQQDVLLPDVEEGAIVLIGATVYNPFFSINSPLISRSQIFQFKPLSEEEIILILRRALADKERGLGKYPVSATDEALMHLAKTSDGDARRALTALEVGVLSAASGCGDTSKEIIFDLRLAEESIQRKAIVYDITGDEHYDAASAFIKSMRGGDPDAALYWMAKMLEAGEDPRFIARRLVICAAEDVGNAAPLALVLANAALQVSEFVGMPEARIPLAQAVIYIATAPKSNSAILAVDKALEDVREGRTLEVPNHLKDANYPGAEKLGRKGYKYAHSYPGHWVEQDYLPAPRTYYEPTEQGYEAKIKERLENWKKRSTSTKKKREGTSRKRSGE